MGLLLLIILIYLIYTINQKEEAIKRLKKYVNSIRKENETLREYVRKVVNTGEIPESIDVVKEEKIKVLEKANEVQKEVIAQREAEVKTKVKIKDPINKEDTKNTTILALGAVFIILAAIVFLVSTWNVIPNIVKTVVLLVFVEVFMVLSRIAKEKFGLKNASNAFFYIAMAYIPICLYSISIFKLFGEYLSIDGAGSSLYFMIVNIIIAAIYYINYQKNKSKILIYSSILMQYLSVICLGLVLSDSFVTVLLNIGIYNLLIYMFSREKETTGINLKNIFKYVVYALTVLLLVSLDQSIVYVFALAVLGINYLLLEKMESNIIHSLVFNGTVLYAGVVGIALLELSDTVTGILTAVYAIGVFLIQNAMIVNKDNINLEKSSLIVTSIYIIFLQFVGLFEEMFVQVYVLAIANIIILLKPYFSNKKMSTAMSSVLIPLETIFASIIVGVKYNFNEHYYMIATFVVFLIGELIRNKKFEDLSKKFFYLSHVNMLATFIILADISDIGNYFIYLIIITELYGYSYFKNRKDNLLFKYLDYVFSNITLIYICELYEAYTLTYLMPIIANLIIMALEKVMAKTYEKDKYSDIYIAANTIFSYLVLIDARSKFVFVIALLYTIFILYKNYKEKNNIYINLIPVIGYLAIMEFSLPEILTIIHGLVFFTLFGYLSIVNKKVNIFTGAGLLVFMKLMYFIKSDLLLNLLIFIYFMAHAIFDNNDKTKDIYRAVVVLLCTKMYFDFITFIGLDEISMFELIGIVSACIILVRKIINKYTDDSDMVEYAVLAITYLSYTISAVGLGDALGVLFVEVLFVFYSYYKKYGATFIVNAVMLLVSVLYLTREFLFMIPWWIYLLVIGSILISVAMKNEAKENKEKINISAIINNVKEKIEK